MDQQGHIPDLVIIGGGSPSLDEHHSDGQPDNIFKQWVKHLQARGIQRINGPVWIDHHYFSGPIRPPSYPGGAKNEQAWYSAPASAFAWNNNCIEIRAVPTTPGQPTRIETRPASSRIPITNRGEDSHAGDKANIYRQPFTQQQCYHGKWILRPTHIMVSCFHLPGS